VTYLLYLLCGPVLDAFDPGEGKAIISIFIEFISPRTDFTRIVIDDSPTMMALNFVI